MAKARRTSKHNPSSNRRRYAKPSNPREKKTLAIEPEGPRPNIWDYTWLIYGEKKIGKTTLCAAIPDADFIFTEPGHRAITARKNVVESWQEIRDLVEALEKDSERAKPRHTGPTIVDTVGRAYDMCFTYICDKLGIQYPLDNDFGKSWKAIRREFDDICTRLMELPKGVVFIAHAEIKNINTRQGSVDKLVPNLTKQALEVLTGNVDSILYYGYDGSDRYLALRGNEQIEGGTRLEQSFLTKIKRRPVQVIDMGNSPKEAYEALVRGFNNQLTRAGVLPVIHIPKRKKK